MKFLNTIPGRWKFLLAVLTAYLLSLVIDANYTKNCLGNFWLTSKGIAPIIALVFFMMFLVNIFLKPAAVTRHLGHDSGLKGWLYALIGSTLISGPPYILMPMLSELKKQGMKPSLIAAFLSNRSVQPVFLPVMAYYFGWQYAIVVSSLIVIFSIINGLAVGKLLK